MFVSGGVVKPNGLPYANPDKDWNFIAMPSGQRACHAKSGRPAAEKHRLAAVLGKEPLAQWQIGQRGPPETRGWHRRSALFQPVQECE
jgi:hypothetical protein